MYKKKEKYTILLVDDDYLNHLYYKEILSPDLYEIIYVTNEIEAISECRENKNIDLVLMDFRMPGIDGKKTVCSIRKYNKNLPILMQSAYIDKEYIKSIEKQHLIDFISKPVKENELLEKINNLLL